MTSSQKKSFLHKFLKGSLYFVGIVAVIITGLVIYYQVVTPLSPPEVADRSAIDWKREQVAKDFYTVKNNWLRRSDSGLWEVYLEGKPFERGAAYGNLAQELLLEQENAFVGRLKQMVPDESYIRFLKYFIAWFNRNIDDHVPLEYQLEIYGESFFGPSGFEYIGENYPRMLNYHAAHDIGHALANANMVGCTSFSVKDAASADSSMVLGRNFDFNMGEKFAKNKIVAFIRPDSGYNHCFITWPGFFGVVSGMNEHGLTITLNAAPSGIPSSARTPISILSREILQYASTIEEATAIAKSRKTFVAELLMIGSAKDRRTVVIEKTTDDMFVYEERDDRLTCSNHFLSDDAGKKEKNGNQFLKTSSAYRYGLVNSLIDQEGALDPLKAASILRNRFGMHGEDLGMGNENALNQLFSHHGVIFKPEERKIWVSCNPYQLGSFICYDLDDVFARTDSVRLTGIEVYDRGGYIPPDTFLNTQEYRNFTDFIFLRDELEARISGKSDREFTETELRNFTALNPRFYLGYALAGKYFRMKKSYGLSEAFFRLASERNIPLQTEREKIEKELTWLQKKQQR